ncbi:MAG: CRISPR-associated endonuclease Cas2 [Alteraurantiacibacter sp.]|nr:CRISPR-associated endonuclease Cas2 [Alteraurantiacibacter sp.]
MRDVARTLYLVCYDVADPKRLYRVHRFLLGYKVGGQKSFFECWLTPAELREVRAGLRARMNLAEDRAHIFQLDPRQRVRCLGQAQPPHAGAFLIV